MSEATVTTLVPKPDEPKPTGSHACPAPGCGRTFDHPQGLGRHHAAMHGTTTERRTPPSPKATKPTAKRTTGRRTTKTPAAPRAATPKATPVPDRQALAALAGTYTTITGADVTTAIDAAGQLLDTIDAHGWTLVAKT